MRKIIVIIALLTLAAFRADATHLVGGEITYTCLGNNVYEIKLRIYRDCSNPGNAAFDNVANITVFTDKRSNGTWRDDWDDILILQAPIGTIYQLPTTVNNPCLQVPPDVCVEYTDYITTVTLPPSPDGYVLTHQRCCRNHTIDNIYNPGSVGNTYTIQIPPNDTACNNSPDFTSSPPIVMCLGDSLHIDASVSEIDGNAITYRLCDPLGTSSSTAIPNPADPPQDYDPVNFRPGYSASYPVPSSPQIAINPITGIITGTPNTVGQYVFAICVDEWRNGQVISTVRRDYQFNVVLCNSNVVSAIITQIEDPGSLCAGTTVNFQENSENGTYFFWDFGDTTTTNDTSSLSNPTYTYPDTGQYEVTLIVNNTFNCADTATVVFQVSHPLNFVTSGSHIACNGDSTGTAEVVVSGGNAPYTVNWSNGATGQLLTGVPAGTYVAVVTDAGGCTDSVTVNITQAAVPLTGNMQIVSHVSCYGETDGVAYVTVDGGTAPYTYEWSNGQTGDTANSLDGGPQWVRYEDAAGCSDSLHFSIQAPDSLELEVNIINNIMCFGEESGSLEGIVIGGTPPYTTFWSSGQVTNVINNLSAGAYTFYVVDAAGCSDSVQVVLSENDALTIQVQQAINIACYNDATGSVDLSISGGEKPYTVQWLHGPTDSILTGLMAGTYTAVVTDANGCDDTVDVTLTQPLAALGGIVSMIQSVSCFGESDGVARVIGQGGTLPYAFEWSNGETGDTATGLAGGAGWVRISDANGCSDTAHFNMAAPASALNLSYTLEQAVTCFGGTDGEASVQATGGTPAYTYSWSNGMSGAWVTGLAAGTYTVAVVDAAGCSDSIDVVVTEPADLNLSIGNIANVDCFDENTGSAEVTATGGVPPYDYVWSNGELGATASSLIAGTHYVIVTDANLCSDTAAVVISQPTAALSSNVVVTQYPMCFGDNSGSGYVAVSGGTPPYTYLWSTGNTIDTISGLISGNYIVNITDDNGCTLTDTLILTQPLTALSGISTIESNVSCFGGNDGALSVAASGGTPPYVYSWSNGSVTAQITGLTAGLYSVVVTDANGCFVTDTLEVTEPPVLNLNAMTLSDVLCFGNAEGAADVNITGGTAPYSVQWSHGSSDSTVSGLLAGDYTVIVTDANGCTDSAQVTITQPAAVLSLSATVNSDVSCFNGNDGSATATASGGIAPYTYSWSNGATTATANNLTAGTYWVSVTDANACIDSIEVTIVQPLASLNVNASVVLNVLCFGGADGIATVVASGGTAPYGYLWSNGSTNDTIIGQTAGNYTIIVTDANGCSDSATLVITEPNPALSVSITSVSHVMCLNGDDGSATATGAGGTPGYTYVWSDGQTTATATNLTAGTYTVYITDANGCADSADVIITEPGTAVLAGTTSTVGVTCLGDASGTATGSGSGGVPPYTYQWADSLGTVIGNSATISGMPGGIYTLTVTDANGCFDTVLVDVPEAEFPLLASAIDGTTISCYGSSDGSAFASATGGFPPYSFAWNTGATGDTLTGIPAGTYTVYVTDSLGCVDSNTVVVNQPDSLSLSIDTILTVSVSCFGGNDGSAAVAVTGGVAPYSYLWNTGETTASIGGLIAGAYTVTVTDDRGCVRVLGIDVAEPDTALDVSVNILNVNCFGGSDGQIYAIVTGGTAPYIYAWSNGYTADSAAGLLPGSYRVVVTDARGCVDSVDAVVSEPLSPLSGNVQVISQPDCSGSLNGDAYAVGAGGTAPYTYAWSTGAIGDTATTMGAGIHYVTITDANGCTYLDSVELISPSANFDVVATPMDSVSCFSGSDGWAIAVAGGGVPPYTYIWDNGITNDTAFGLAAGFYRVTVIDSNGCTAVDRIEILEPDTFVISDAGSVNNVSCFGGSNGSAFAIATGGSGVYTYNWSNGMTGDTIYGLSAGKYTVTATDINGCQDTASVFITEPFMAANVAAAMDSEPSCFGSSDGRATALGTGGTPPYTYVWSNGQTTATAINLAVGTYSVVITDSLGCTDSTEVVITEPDPVAASTSSAVGVTCAGDVDGSAVATATGGTPPYTFEWRDSLNILLGTSDSISGLAGGTYVLTARDSNGCEDTVHVYIHDPQIMLFVSSATAISASCYGSDDGMAYATAAGGVPPYDFSWSDGQTGDTATGLLTGTYIVTVTDAMGCLNTDTVLISQPDSLTAEPDFVAVSCFGGSDARAWFTVAGGTSPYTYLWSNGQTADTALGLAAGTHTVTITDANNCTLTASVAVTEPAAAVDVTAVMTQSVSCFGGSDGVATATGSGGTPGYQYLWSNGVTTAVNSGLTAGIYSVEVIDSLGCTDTANVVITEPAMALDASISLIRHVSCFAGSDGALVASAVGGTAPYTYVWTTSSVNDTLSGLTAGSYGVTITDANGCTDTARFVITQPAAVLEAMAVMRAPVSCFGGSDGEAEVTATGGTAPYMYLWDDGAAQTTDTAIGLVAGSYTVLVTDANGCTDQVVVNITQPAMALNASAVEISAVNCFGGSDGELRAAAIGGTPPYTYLWNTGQTTVLMTGLSAGVYSVLVSDSMGCTDTASVVLTEPASAVDVSASMTQAVACFGNATGRATASASGGVAPYIYNWSSGHTGPNAVNLSAGIYWVTVTDANGCIDSTSVTITQPSNALEASAMMTQAVNCFAGTDGSASASAAGGTAPYTYRWSTGVNGQTLTGVPAGNYWVRVTDANGCTDTANITITQPSAPLAVTATMSHAVSCLNGSDGVAVATPTGGTPPYTYLWSNGQSADTATGLIAGSHFVEVWDANGCRRVASVVITQPSDAIAVTALQVQSVQCFGGSDGMATVNIQFGNPPYSYIWSNGQTTDTATGLSAGSYSVTVVDSTGCQGTASVVITQPNRALDLVTTMTSAVRCFGGADGEGHVFVSGGTAPYSIYWQGGQTTPYAYNLTAGVHVVTITDANGCVDSASVVITQPATPVDVQTSVITTVACFGGSDGVAEALGSGGTPPYTYLWSNSQTQATASGLMAGSYTVTVTDANGCTDTAQVIMTQPTMAVEATITSFTDVSCFGGNDGTANVSAIGGTAPYQYTWSNAQTSASATGLDSGVFYVAVTDARGCTDTAYVTISQPAMPVQAVVGVTQNVLCHGGNNGEAFVQPTGGTAPYTVQWSHGPVSNTVNGLFAGTYTVTVTDAKGCVDSTSLVITQPVAPIQAIVVTQFDVECYGESTGAMAVVVSGGTMPYSYSWSTSGTGNNVTNVPAGTHVVTITDANGCVFVTDGTVTQPDFPLFADVDVLNNVNCFGGSDGSAQINVSGGVGPYAVTWFDGSNGNVVQNLGVGSYTVDVVDSNGCSFTTNFSISEPNAALASFNDVQMISCGGASSGEIRVVPIGGTPPYLVQWDRGGTGNTLSNLPQGIYGYKVIDAGGCEWVDSVEVEENPPIEATIYTEPATCITSPDGYLEVDLEGGTAPYDLYVDGRPFSGSLAGLTPGSYGLTIIDNLGCDTTFQFNMGMEQDSLYLHIPNAFTPNYDRINEEYAIYGSTCISGGVFMIFDRWGNKVFESDDPFNTFWDGMINGEHAKSDTYVWRFDSPDYKRAGWVVVIR